MVLESNAQKSNRHNRRKMKGSLLALGTAAVVSIYTVGYMKTGSSLDNLAAQVSNTPSAAVPGASAPILPTTSPAAAAGSAAAATSTPTAASGLTYVDGSYTGTGNSRHGSITATVVIAGGKIVSAAVTNCATRYPCSDVNPLVSSVVSSQALPNSNVSGATDSSNAYRTAVKAALQKALA